MQGHLLCGGCRHYLVYPRGAGSVRCSICNTINSVATPAFETAQIVCMGCRALLTYPRGATSVRCVCCRATNDASSGSPFAQVNCIHCHTTLAYPSGALSVKCAMCQNITNIEVADSRSPNALNRTDGAMLRQMPPTFAMPQPHSQTVVVENPMTIDGNGKLVSNVMVGVTTEKK